MIIKILKVAGITLVLSATLVLTGYFAIKRQSNYVDLSKVNNESVFFYKDDCPDCTKVYPQLLWDKITGKKIIFINMNNNKNMKYADEYFFSNVPTVIKYKDGQVYQMYTGTNIKQIDKTFGY